MLPDGLTADKGVIVRVKEKQSDGGYISSAGFSPLASALITVMRCRWRVGSGTPHQRRCFGQERHVIGLRAPCSREQLGLSADRMEIHSKRWKYDILNFIQVKKFSVNKLLQN